MVGVVVVGEIVGEGDGLAVGNGDGIHVGTSEAATMGMVCRRRRRIRPSVAGGAAFILALVVATLADADE